MSLPSYPVYKDSGVSWLGNVPKHWTVNRLKFAAHLNPSKTEISDWDRETLVSFLPMEAIGDDGSVRLDLEKTIAELESGYTYFRNGDIVVAKITPCFENGKGALLQGLPTGVGFGTTELIVARPRPDYVTGDFLNYVIRSTIFRDRGTAEMYGAGGQKRVPDSFVEDFPLPLPPIDEQIAITSFLHSEVRKAEALINEQKRLSDLLTEKRQALIFDAVTKGIHRNVSMKASRIEWLGSVPSHWRVMPIRYAAKLESGHTPSRQRPDWWVDCTIPWFSLADIWQIREAGVDYITDTAEKVSEVGLANSSARLLPAGTVMLSRTASVGFSAIMGVDMATTQDFANWVPGAALAPEFLLYVFRAMGGEFERLRMGSTHNTIYMPDIQSLKFALPPIEEQREIVRYIREKCAEADRLIAEGQRAIVLLRERQSALISAAVTGRIDVQHTYRQLDELHA